MAATAAYTTAQEVWAHPMTTPTMTVLPNHAVMSVLPNPAVMTVLPNPAVMTVLPNPAVSCVCSLSCRATGCAGCCAGTPNYWAHAASRACCGTGMCTVGCGVVLSSPVVMTTARAVPVTSSHHAWNYCHVHDSEKSRVVTTSAMRTKDVVTSSIKMVPTTSLVRKTVMRPHSTTSYVQNMKKQVVNKKEWQYVPTQQMVKKTVMMTKKVQ